MAEATLTKGVRLGKFPLGRCVMTAGVNELVASGRINPLALLARHATGDWGEVDDHDKRENELSLKEGLRILSAYTVNDVKVWVITEADRSATTILFPDEY